MSEKENRLFFYCPEIVGADGTKLELRQLGKIPAATKDEDVESAMDIYVNSLSRSFNETGVSMFDVALVDGRFRVQCAIKLLPYLHDDSVLLMHDFFVRKVRVSVHVFNMNFRLCTSSVLTKVYSSLFFLLELKRMALS